SAGTPSPSSPELAKSVWRLGPLCLFFLCLFLHISSAQIRYTIPEELTRGAFVGNIAKDLGTEVAKLAAANLQVLSDSDSQYLSVNVNSGVIVVNDRIDREHLCGQYPRCFLHLKLAIDNPVELYRIEVEILDINDNPPEFPSGETTLQIYELASLGARFPIAQAQDPDVGSNALQTYRLSANENFSLNVKARTDGCKFPELVLERALDREQRAVHHLVLTAEDGGSPPMSSKTRIAVQVLDANDNHPVFDTPAYRARLVENSPSGTLVIQLNATDMDEGPNGDLRYSLSSHNSEAVRRIFAVHEQTGEIRVQGDIDFEEASLYELEVEAKDMGSPTMEQHCTLCGASPTCSLPLQLVLESPLQLHRLEVEILDVNDNAPRFPKTEVSLELTEVANPGTRLPLEVAEDPDMGSGSIATYHLSPSDHFALSISLRGDGVKMPEIVLEKALDREKVVAHHLTLTALDGGSPVRSGTARITVHVLDANDNPPVCDPPISKVFLEENVPVGTLVTQLNVTDLDEGPNGEVEYSFKPSNNAPDKLLHLFSLDPWTGQIRTKGLLDYEDSSAYELTIRARDKGSPAMEGHCSLRVELVDVNDNSPDIVLTSLSSPVLEDAPPGTVIALIGAKDSDSGGNGHVHLQMRDHLPFTLVSSFQGQYSLVTAGPLDREKAGEYNITITATDSGSPRRATEKTISLQISDVNDNTPHFSSPSYTAHIQENTLPGASVLSVSASDPDMGSNSKLSYSILDSGVQALPLSTYFHINPENGTISTLRALDYEQEKVFQVPVQVKDAGAPPLSSTATVHVFVLDENDNTPTIVYPPALQGSAFHQTVPLAAQPDSPLFSFSPFKAAVASWGKCIPFTWTARGRGKVQAVCNGGGRPDCE
uniref:Cadherin domain-containing protein n=1 Tax=Pelusios castaneus TaxID=367368 RepID=A0A8C8SB63_9SAUR